MKYLDYESIPVEVQAMVLSMADAVVITDVDLETLNEWIAEHLEAFKHLAGVYE